MRGNTIPIEMSLKRGKVAKTIPLYQWDYGQKLVFVNTDMPTYYEVHFSNSNNGESITMIGSSSGVDIPDDLLRTGLPIYLWAYLHLTGDDGETEYAGVIPVIKRAEPTDIEPTPTQANAIAQAIEALNDAVEVAVAEATEASEAAQAAAEDAQEKAEEARDAAQAAAGDFQGISATAEGLDEDEDPTIEVTHSEGGLYTFAFGIPKGEKGDKGDEGDPAPQATVEAAVEAWLEENVDPETGYVLDRNLSSSEAAAPADLVGDIDDKVTELPKIKETTESAADLYLTDSSGNVLAQFSGGHIQTKNFNSSNIPAPTSIIDDTAGSGDTNKVWSADKVDGEIKNNASVKGTNATAGDLDLTDTNGNVILRLGSGHLQTKEFNSANIHNVPSGGLTDQILAKNSGTDYDLKWISRKLRSRMEFGAHNGAEYYAPECTIPAYRIAGQQGWEWAWIAGIDFSTDGTMYVIHDDTVDRTTDGTGYLNQMSDTQINALNVDIVNGDYSLSDFDSSELKIPTFEQVVQQCVRYGMKMVIRLHLFPNGKNTAENTAKWEAFESIIHGYGIQPEDMSCYLDSGTKATTCRALFGDDVEISVHLGLNATAQDFVDWFESRSITGRRAAILSYQNTNLTAVKLLHAHGIRCYSYGSNLQANADTCASLGVDVYQNGKIHEISY